MEQISSLRNCLIRVVTIFPAAHNAYYEILGYEPPVAGILRVHTVVTECEIIVLPKSVVCHIIGWPGACLVFNDRAVYGAPYGIQLYGLTFLQYIQRAEVLDCPHRARERHRRHKCGTPQYAVRSITYVELIIKDTDCTGIVVVPGYAIPDANGIAWSADHTLAIHVVNLELYLGPLVITQRVIEAYNIAGAYLSESGQPETLKRCVVAEIKRLIYPCGFFCAILR